MKNERGQTLFELIAAISVGIIIVTAIVSTATISLTNTNFSKTQGQATYFAQEGSEYIRAQRDSGWAGFYGRGSASGQTYCLDTLSWANIGACSTNQAISGTSFYREAKMTQIDANTIDVQIVVYWNDNSGRHTSSLNTQLTSWRGQ